MSQSSIAASVGSTASNIGATMLLTLGWERDTLQFTLAMRLLAPISGIVFLLFAPSLWPRVVIAVILVAVIELVTTSLMLAFLMPLQAEVISLLIGDAAGWTFATSLTLVEAGALVWFLCNVVTDHVRRRIYDEVFVLHSIERASLTETPRILRIKEGLWTAVIVVVLFVSASPLNLIPLVGTALWVAAVAWAFGWGIHAMYLTSAGFTLKQQCNWVFLTKWQRWLEYELFGALALLLQLVPVFNVLFFFTNVVGGALWACELERCGDLAEVRGESTSLLSSKSPGDDEKHSSAVSAEV